VERFQALLRVAIEIAREGKHLVTLGIVPDRPATGYGCIQKGDLFISCRGFEIFRAKKFLEKPNQATAERFLTSGEYYWNSGMFIWRVDTILEALETYMPELYKGLEDLRPHLGRPEWPEILAQVYAGLPSISIDYGVMEKAKNVLFIHARYRLERFWRLVCPFGCN